MAAKTVKRASAKFFAGRKGVRRSDHFVHAELGDVKDESLHQKARNCVRKIVTTNMPSIQVSPNNTTSWF